MKKLLSVMIGLGLMMGTVSLFAQTPTAPPAEEKTGTETKKKTKKSKKKTAPAEEKKTA